MSNSTIVEWLVENNMRCYPITQDSLGMAQHHRTIYNLFNIFLDAMLVYADMPANDPQITGIITNATDLIITVNGQSNFTLANYTSSSYPMYVRNNEKSLLVLGEEAKLFANNMSMSISNVLFEPTVSVHVPSSMLGISSLSVVDSGQLTGDVELIEGYQLGLVPSKNKLNIEVGRNEGVPLACSQVYTLPADCGNIVTYINGASPNKMGSVIKFDAGRHINVYSDQANNRVYIGFDFSTEDVPTQVLIRPNRL